MQHQPMVCAYFLFLFFFVIMARWIVVMEGKNYPEGYCKQAMEIRPKSGPQPAARSIPLPPPPPHRVLSVLSFVQVTTNMN